MSLLQIGEPKAPVRSGFALFALGFRTFFLSGALAAVLLVGLWLLLFSGVVQWPTYYGLIGWHSHEMLFGYAAAVVAGFLLTAARNWTGLPTLHGRGLAILAGFWLLARLLPFLPEVLPRGSVALVDGAFLPAVAVALAIPLWRARHDKSYLFVAILVLMGLANALVHLQALGIADTAQVGIYLMLDLLVLLLAILAGRVVPFFTEKAIFGAQPRSWRPVEITAIGAIVALVLVEALYPQPILLAAITLAAAIAHGLRLGGWYHRGIWSQPLLWILHVGYAWLALGLGLRGLAVAGLFSPVLALHALTIGALGAITIGMMARVSLGHTGRPLQLPDWMNGAFILVGLAALARVFIPALSPQHYLQEVVVAGTLWIAAFAIFTYRYFPIWWRPRIDGRPG